MAEREAEVGAAATTGAAVLRGGAWYATSQYVPQLYSLALSVIAARFLGPEGMGRQSFIAFAALSMTTLLTAPLYVALMRYVGETMGRGRPEAARGLLRWAWGIEAVFASLAAGLFAVLAVLGADPQAAWVLAGFFSALTVMHAVPSAVLVGLQRFREASIAGLFTGAIGIGATTAVLAAGGGITGMFAVEVVLAAVNLAWTGMLAVRRLDVVAPRAVASPELRHQVTRYALVTALGVFLEVIVSRRSELFFLNRFSTDSEMALYSISFAAMAALVQIPRSFAGSVSPAFATLYGAGAHDRIRRGYERGLRLLLIGGLPVLALSLVTGPRLLRLVYGEEYSGTGPVLLVLLIAFPIIPITSLSNGLLIGFGKLRVPLVANVAAAVVDVGLAIALIPSLEAVGAAIANVGALVVFGVVQIVAAIRLTAPVELRPAALLRSVAAVGAAGLAGWAVIDSVPGVGGLFAAGAVVVSVYALLAVALRILPSDDAAWLDRAAGSHLGGAVGRACRLCAARPREAI